MKKQTAGRYHLRRALEILTRPDRVATTHALGQNARGFSCWRKEWLSQPGIQGLGVARRRTKGKLLRQLALKVYVSKKLPRSKCQRVVPTKLQIPGLCIEIETDVEEVGEIRLHGNTGIVHPLFRGPASDARLEALVLSDALCARLRSRTISISLARATRSCSGAPARSETLCSSLPGRTIQKVRYVGSLSSKRAVDLNLVADGFPNLCDVAIARLDPAVPWSAEIPGIGIPTAVFTNLRTGMRVRYEWLDERADEGTDRRH